MVSRLEIGKSAVGLLVLAAVVAWSVVAAAEISERAIESMEDGARAYADEEFADAEVEFRRAYELSGYAIFSFNAGRASHRGGNKRQAYLHYQRALNVDDPEKRLGAEDEARALAYSNALAVVFDGQATHAGIVAVQPDIRDVRWSQWGWTGTGLAATGGLLLVVAGGYGVSASRGIEGLQGIESVQQYEEQRGHIESRQRRGKSFLYGGGALVLAGAGLAIWDLTTVKEKAFPRVSISPDGVFAVWEVRFE